MADEKLAESKPPKPGLLRRIGWWIWVILLTALLVLGLVFAAPWKVITLIAIFLAAATILPRIYRKWFWLAVGLVVLATIAWIFLPDDNKGWRPYTFDKELAQLQARYAVPDSENAAILYNQILADWKQKEANEPNLPRDKFDFARHNFWPTKDLPEAAEYMQYYQNTIEKVLQTSKIEKCSFPIIANVFDSVTNMDRLSAMRQWAYLFVITANNDIAEGKKDEAIDKYLAILRMSQHLSHQPNNLDMLVGAAIDSLGLGCINNFVILGDVNDFCLGKLEQAVSGIKHDFNSDLTGFIDYDKLVAKNTWGLMFYEINAAGKTRFCRDPSKLFKERAKKQLATGNAAEVKLAELELKSYGYWYKKFMKAYTIAYWFYLPKTPERLGIIIDVSYDQCYIMTKSDFDWSKIPPEVPLDSFVQFMKFGLNIKELFKFTAKIDERLYSNAHDIYLRAAAQQRGTMLIIALRKHKNANGHWPDSLDDVKTLVSAETFVDPMNNGSFVYKQTDDGFTLYGKGKNGIDEEGKYENNWLAKPGADDLLIWPFKSKVSQQQKQKTEK